MMALLPFGGTAVSLLRKVARIAHSQGIARMTSSQRVQVDSKIVGESGSKSESFGE